MMEQASLYFSLDQRFKVKKTLLQSASLPFVFITKLRPHLPSWPPSIPYGCKTLLSLRIDTVSGRNASISRTTPSPPLYLPFPPLPSRRENCLNSTGYLLSKISGSVMRVLVQWVCIPLFPLLLHKTSFNPQVKMW